MSTPISIVTAFFDIGRGDWSVDKGHPKYLQRSVEKYLEFFKNLSELDNHIIVFTEKKMVDSILKIRNGKKTTIITLSLEKEFSDYLQKITDIQGSNEFQSIVNAQQINNPEYWSSKYVLITNLKPYFVNKAINDLDLKDDLLAWIDFGYCRSKENLVGLKEWKFDFNKDKVNLFTIKKSFDFNEDNVKKAILNNEPYIIGGVAVASKEKWKIFFEITKECQHNLLKSNMVDDDQGIYMMAKLKNPELISLNYLGKKQWFSLFKRYSQNRSLLESIKMLFGF